MKFKVVFKFINSYTNQSFISISRFNSKTEIQNFLQTRWSWQKWEIVRIEEDL